MCPPNVLFVRVLNIIAVESNICLHLTFAMELKVNKFSFKINTDLNELQLYYNVYEKCTTCVTSSLNEDSENCFRKNQFLNARL